MSLWARQYLAQVDARTAGMSSQHAENYLDGQLSGWVRRYAEFAHRALCSEKTAAPVAPVASIGSMEAWDYVMTIAGLDQRRAQLHQGEQEACCICQETS